MLLLTFYKKPDISQQHCPYEMTEIIQSDIEFITSAVFRNRVFTWFTTLVLCIGFVSSVSSY